MKSLSYQKLWQSFLDTEPSLFDLMSVMSLRPFRLLAWKEFCSRNPTPSQYWTVFSSSSSARELTALAWKQMSVNDMSNDQLIFVIRKRRQHAMAAWRVLKTRNPRNAELREILRSDPLFLPAVKLLLRNLQLNDAHLTFSRFELHLKDEGLEMDQIVRQFPTDEVLTYVMIYFEGQIQRSAAAKVMESFPNLGSLRLIRRNFPALREEATRLLNRKKFKIIAKMERASTDST